jgi:hypothetical protein
MIRIDAAARWMDVAWATIPAIMRRLCQFNDGDRYPRFGSMIGVTPRETD